VRLPDRNEGEAGPAQSRLCRDKLCVDAGYLLYYFPNDLNIFSKLNYLNNWKTIRFSFYL